jgi:hypothetical protein
MALGITNTHTFPVTDQSKFTQKGNSSDTVVIELKTFPLESLQILQKLNGIRQGIINPHALNKKRIIIQSSPIPGSHKPSGSSSLRNSQLLKEISRASGKQ